MGSLVRLLILLAVLSGCAAFRETPPTVRPFPLHPGWTEVQADPGPVNLKCYADGKGFSDSGQRWDWNQEFCECLIRADKQVWISRHPVCMSKLEKIRWHASCHIALGNSRPARKICGTDYKT